MSAWSGTWHGHSDGQSTRGQHRAVAAVDNGASQAQRSAGTGGQHHSPSRGRSRADVGEPLVCLEDSALGKEAGGL